MELMVERILLIDSVRDIGLNIRQAMEMVENGVSKETVLTEARNRLTSNPVLGATFVNSTYEELIAFTKLWTCCLPAILNPNERCLKNKFVFVYENKFFKAWPQSRSRTLADLCTYFFVT